MDNKEIPQEILNIINRCRRAEINKKKKQQQYCIEKYYKSKQTDTKKED